MYQDECQEIFNDISMRYEIKLAEIIFKFFTIDDKSLPDTKIRRSFETKRAITVSTNEYKDTLSGELKFIFALGIFSRIKKNPIIMSIDEINEKNYLKTLYDALTFESGVSDYQALLLKHLSSVSICYSRSENEFNLMNVYDKFIKKRIDLKLIYNHLHNKLKTLLEPVGPQNEDTYYDSMFPL